MEIAYKDFHRKMAPFREESLEDILENQVNQWIRLNNIQVINVETLWERNSHVSVGVRVWYIKRKALKKLQPQKELPFVADKGYDAVDIIESLLDRGFEPAIRIKETMRMSIKHPLRKLSNENWKRYGKIRYRVEQLFGSIKQKIGSSFKLLREDLARKASIACAILWNFWLLATYLFLLFLSGILHYGYAKDCGRFLEQPR
jgi:hypothetical protein